LPPSADPRRRAFRLAWAVAALAVIADQATKTWIVHVVMAPPRLITVTPFFNVVMVWNKGASFGFLNIGETWVPWLLSAIAVVVTVALVVWLRRTDRAWLAVGLGLIIGGALGNLIDRLVYGAVADFIQLYAGRFYWPAFNVADSAITVGVGLVLLDGFTAGKRGNAAAAGPTG
jgi:signal peptidase II